MSIKLNHTIVHAHDKEASAKFLVELFGLAPPIPFGPFLTVRVDNDVTLDYIETQDKIHAEHYAFLVDEDEFDVIFGRIKARKMSYWGDPAKQRPNETFVFNGGRGVYFEDPSGHFLEIITRPYF
jgi:catechol 2,3-dioxygenase-like lactoylglutathione lyase family enzyme